MKIDCGMVPDDFVEIEAGGDYELRIYVSEGKDSAVVYVNVRDILPAIVLMAELYNRQPKVRQLVLTQEAGEVEVLV